MCGGNQKWSHVEGVDDPTGGCGAHNGRASSVRGAPRPMKPAPFAYCRPGSLDEASAILAEDEDARIIAGGQTLTPLLAMRLARPSKLADIMRIPGLDALVEEDDAIVLGAAARQSVVERNATIRAKLPLLAA